MQHTQGSIQRRLGGRWRHEAPVSELRGDGSIVRGEADQTLETDDGLVVVDHKRFPGPVDDGIERRKPFSASGSVRFDRQQGLDACGTWMTTGCTEVACDAEPSAATILNRGHEDHLAEGERGGAVGRDDPENGH